MAKRKPDEDVKKEIIQAASILFQKYGFHKTTMEDIAKLAGKGKSTLYYYYQSKEEVIAAVAQKIGIEFQTNISKEISNFSSAVEKFTAFFKGTIKHAQVISAEYFIPRRDMVDDFVIKPRILMDDMNEISKRGIKMIEDIITLGIKNGEFSIETEKVPHLAEIVNTTIKGIVMSEMIGVNNIDWDKKIMLFGEIFVKGIK